MLRTARLEAGSKTCVAASPSCANRTFSFFDGLLKIALAEAEARAGDCDRAVAILDEALATSDRTGYRAFEAELHRARGEILLKRDPANPAPAEDAYLTAIAVAKQQATRSFELRAALALAKLYRSRPDAPPTPTPFSRPRSKASRRSLSRPGEGPGMRVLPHPAKPPMPSPPTLLPDGRGGRPPPKCPRSPRRGRCWPRWRRATRSRRRPRSGGD